MDLWCCQFEELDRRFDFAGRHPAETVQHVQRFSAARLANLLMVSAVATANGVILSLGEVN